jgi:aldehyde dehydrogenase (NAD+)
MNYSQIFKSQKEFFNSQTTKDIAFRKKNLLKLKNVLKDNESLLFEAIYKDFRKSEFDTFANELNLVYHEIDYLLKNINRLSKPQKVKTGIALFPGKSYIYSEPLGCTLIIGAWNYPYSLTLIPLVSSMAAGNTSIIKPSELPANAMHAIAELINTNFPSEYLYVVEGGIPETTELLKLPYDKIFFTGSPRVGRIVYEAAAKNLTPVTLELGGKSPAIVTDSADLEVAVRRIIWGKFLNAGQTCVAPDYLLVEESIKPKLMELIKQKLDVFNYADGAENYVSIINKKNFDRVLRLIEPSKVFYGGEHNENTLYIQPTILDNITWNDSVMQEEIFGPVLPVLSYSDFNGMLCEITKREKPLAAYLFTENKQQKMTFLKTLSFGGGCINDTLMHLTVDSLPFGGVGNSGMGNYHGDFGFITFSHQKSILDRKNWGEPAFKYPPYSKTKLNWIKRFM